MKCSECGKKAINHKEKNYCKNCFQKIVEEEFRKIKPFLEKYERIGVAVSGGKDSLTLLYLAKRFFPKKEIIGLCVDEGIHDYREHTLKSLEKYGKKWGINYIIVSFKQEFGKTLDEMTKKIKNMGTPCSYCGILRRYLLNKYAKELKLDCLLTGHNLDDEAQSVIMNFFNNNYNKMIRLGVESGVSKTKSFVPRLKPFRELSEKQIMTYFVSKGFNTPMSDCPYARISFRAQVRDELNRIEEKTPVKKKIIKGFDKVITPLKKKEKGKIGNTETSMKKIIELLEQ